MILFRLKDRSRENIGRVRDMLLTLADTVPVVRSLEAGVDFLHLKRSYDIALTVRLDSRADLDAYQRHPAHLAVAEYIKEVRDAVVSVDYES